MRLYTKEQLILKFNNWFIEVLPYHYEKKDKRGNWITVYELISKSKTINENNKKPFEI